MTKRILKWESWHPDTIGLIGTFPRGKVVLVAAQTPDRELPTLWIEHEMEDLSPFVGKEPDIKVEASESSLVDHYIVVGTGHYVTQDMVEHVGSCVCASGGLVWHVYKVMNERDVAKAFVR